MKPRTRSIRAASLSPKGPLAHLLKNRIYLGQTGHGGKWYAGEHEPIVDRKTFDAVQRTIPDIRTERRTQQLASGALLAGKLFDDRGNRMRASFSVKKGVRYRFYASSAVLRRRKGKAGSVARVPAHDIEVAIAEALRKRLAIEADATTSDVLTHLERAMIKADRIVVSAVAVDGSSPTFEIPWQPQAKAGPPQVELVTSQVDQKLLQAVVRAHAWIRQLAVGNFKTIEDLARAADYNPKVVRQNLRLAFLPPEVTAKVIAGEPVPFTLATIPKQLPLDWDMQRKRLIPRMVSSGSRAELGP